MELTYRTAVPEDLDAVFRLVSDAIAQMERQNIRQWDSIYPAKADFRKDIEKRQLFIGCVNDALAVVYALNRECDVQYRNGSWRYTGPDYIVVHRLCVAPEYQNRGLAHAALLHIEREARRHGCRAVPICPQAVHLARLLHDWHSVLEEGQVFPYGKAIVGPFRCISA